MAPRFRLLLIVSAAILVLDQVSKIVIDSRFALYESVTVIENFFAITYVRNKGAAFGILADSAIRVPFFITVAVIASAGILWYLRQIRDAQKLLTWGLSLIFSGAIGNLIDRIRLGEVIDFLDAHWYAHHWPAFNVADSAICIGVGLMLIDMWRQEKANKEGR